MQTRLWRSFRWRRRQGWQVSIFVNPVVYHLFLEFQERTILSSFGFRLGMSLRFHGFIAGFLQNCIPFRCIKTS